MNDINELPNLAHWCQVFKEKTDLRIHPQNVPAEIILDELLGKAKVAFAAISRLSGTVDFLGERICILEQNLADKKQNKKGAKNDSNN